MNKCLNENHCESGYSSEEETQEKLTKNQCGICDKTIPGPRIGLVVHFGNHHIHSTLREIGLLVSISELHKIVKIRNRAINRALTIQE